MIMNQICICICMTKCRAGFATVLWSEISNLWGRTKVNIEKFVVQVPTTNPTIHSD
jgi:hypothetical protein